MGLHKQNMASVMSMPPGFRASRAAPALPSSLAGLVAWGEGSDLGADGTAISSWLNKTSSGLDPAQATGANQPTVKANAINGQKAALFTAASLQYLAFPAGALGWIQNVAGATVLAVVQPATVGNGRILIASVNASATARFSIAGQTTGYRGVARAVDADAGMVTDSAPGTQIVGVPVIVGCAASLTTPLLTEFLNGAPVATTNTGTTVGNVANTPSQSITVGATGLPNNPFDGYIAAYAMWNVAYSRSQLSGVLNRWSQLYGIPLAG